ncbi:MAG: glycoside hydrolase family 3 C-terminal domain-containing protein, partial [Lachnospiraceae bacterium]
GNAYSIMAAYNRLYGQHCCHSDFLLNQVLRKEWQYDGVVISDWGGVHDTKEAAESQLDIEMSVTYDFDDYFMANPLKKKILLGEISESVVDEKVVHILMLMMRLHMLDGKRKSGAYNTVAHHKKALEVARESVVLLKNESNRLPLDKKKLRKLLLVGENAECIHSSGGGSAEIKALYEISPLMGMKMHLGGNVEVAYAQGYCREEKQTDNENNWQETSLEGGGGHVHKEQFFDRALEQKRTKLREEAVEMAKKYDTVIYIGGLNHDYDCEGIDRKDMVLPYEQDTLIQELLKVKQDLIVVLIGGSPVEMRKWIENAHTVVWSWYAGMEGGNALADVLLGEVNPSGKLPETFYKNHLECSAHALGEFPGINTVAYTEGRYVGYRYNDTFHVEPQFCFGHGLSYTHFDYSEMKVKSQESIISCKVRNVGSMAGKETIQVYRHKKDFNDAPYQELVGFEKISLDVGETKEVLIEVEDINQKEYVYWVGTSSRDIRLGK